MNLPEELIGPYKEERREQSLVDFSSHYGIWVASYDESSLRIIGQSNNIHDQALYTARDLDFLPSDAEFNFTYPESQVRGELASKGFLDEGERFVAPENIPDPLIDEVSQLTDFWFEYDVKPDEGVLRFYGVDLPLKGRDGELSPEARLLTHLSDADADAGIEWDDDYGHFRPLGLHALSGLKRHGLVWGNSSAGYRLKPELPPGMTEDLEEIVEKHHPRATSKTGK